MQMSVLQYLMLAISLVICSNKGSTANNATRFVQKTTCTCPGNVVTYECTVMTGGGTIWTGSAFDCANNGNEIYLLEHYFRLNASASDITCNNGMITGQVVHTDGRHYTSQLNVTLDYDFVGGTIECIYIDGKQSPIATNRIGDAFINLYEHPPPEELTLSLIDFGLKEVTFTWNPVSTNCSINMHYNILASNCGSCPTATNHTNVTCADIPADGSMCIFTVRTVVCGNITGNVSDAARGIFKATDAEVISASAGCIGATASASIFATGLAISVILFTSVIIVLIKANKRAHRIELATRRRARLSRCEENPASHDEPRITMEAESTFNTTIYDDMDYEIAKVAVIATNKNIAYTDTVMGQTEPNVKEPLDKNLNFQHAGNL